MKHIPYGKQFIDKNDITAVKKTLRNNFLTSGKEVKKFENAFSQKIGVKFSISCSNATSALLLCYLALKVKKDDVLIMPSINFIASTNMANFLGAKIYLTDVDPLTGHMRPQDLLSCIKRNKVKKIHTVILMHNGGLPAKIKEIKKIQKKFKFNIIEDACHALGAKYEPNLKNYVGDCKYSDLSVFSFHPVKNITTGEGGMITTNNKKLYKKILILRNHGIIRKQTKINEYNWSYKIDMPGFNFRLNDFQCALGTSQLKKLDKFIKRRREIAKKYYDNFLSIKNFISFPQLEQCRLSAFHLFIINFNLKKIKIRKNAIIKELFKKHIITQVHYIPIFIFSYYKTLFKKKYFQNAIKYYKTSLSIPIFYELKDRQIDYISREIKRIIIKNQK